QGVVPRSAATAGATAVPIVRWVGAAHHEAGRGAVGGFAYTVPQRAAVGEPGVIELIDGVFRAVSAHVGEVNLAERIDAVQIVDIARGNVFDLIVALRSQIVKDLLVKHGTLV